MEEEQKKFSPVDFIIAGLLITVSAVASIVELIAVGTIVGSPLAIITTGVDIVIYAILQFWFILKGVRGLSLAVGAILDVAGLPAVDVISLVVTMYLANHPKAAATVTAAAGKKGLGKTGAPHGKAPGGALGGTGQDLSKPARSIEELKQRDEGRPAPARSIEELAARDKALGEERGGNAGNVVYGQFGGGAAIGRGEQGTESAPERREEGRKAPEEVFTEPLAEVEKHMTEKAVPTMQDIENQQGKAA